MLSSASKNMLPISFQELEIPMPENGLDQLNAEALNKYLQALFLLRETLKVAWKEQPDSLVEFDIVLSAALMIAADRRGGVTELMGTAQILGWVDNGVDIWPIIEARLRIYYENLKIGSKERISNIPIVGVVGKIASGKGTVAEVLGKNIDVLSFPFSDRLRAISLAMGFEPPYNRGELRQINDLYKPAFGNQIFVAWTMMMAGRMAKSLHVPGMIVVDGFRSVEEAKFFSDQENTHLLAIVASDDDDEDRLIRFERQKLRHRGDEDSLMMDEFMKDDSVESAWIDPVIALVRTRGKIIYNRGSLDDLSAAIMDAVGDILPKTTDPSIED